MKALIVYSFVALSSIAVSLIAVSAHVPEVGPLSEVSNLSIVRIALAAPVADPVHGLACGLPDSDKAVAIACAGE